MEMLYLIWRELGMGFFRPEWRSHEGGKKKFPRESRKAHPRFPMNGLAGIVNDFTYGYHSTVD